MKLLDPRSSFLPHLLVIGLALALGANWWQSLLAGAGSFVLGGTWYIVDLHRYKATLVRQVDDNRERILGLLCEELLPAQKLARLRELRAHFPTLDDAQLLKRIDREHDDSLQGEA